MVGSAGLRKERELVLLALGSELILGALESSPKMLKVTMQLHQ